jgi:ribonuclease-3
VRHEPDAAGSDTDAGDLAALLGHSFRDPELLQTALTHPSRAYEEGGGRGNERLEFLGDAVLDLVVAELLFEARPSWSEGDLTRARAALVNSRALAARAHALGIAHFARLGRTEERSGGARKDRVLANLFEALVGALYLDGGLGVARAFLERALGPDLRAGARVLEPDPKTRFQEWAHVRFQSTPSYRPVADSGVENDEQRFSVEVLVGGEAWGRGTARTKRAAERAAAEEALRRADALED